MLCAYIDKNGDLIIENGDKPNEDNKIDVNIENKIIDAELIEKIDEINEIMNIEEINTEKITEKDDEILDEKTEKITEKIEILDEIFLNENTEIVEVTNGDNLVIETIDKASSNIIVHDNIKSNEEDALVIAIELIGMGIYIYIYIHTYIYIYIYIHLVLTIESTVGM
jgi:hypothetical protein